MTERPPATASWPSRLLAFPFRGLIWIYRYAISPLLGANCRFQPSCSAYAEESLRRYGIVGGGWLALKRISRCHPWGGSGHDPVPEPAPDAHDRR